MRQADFITVIAAIVLVAGILLALMPVEIRFFYRWGMDEHSLVLRFQFFWGRVGFGTKFFLGKNKIKEKSRLAMPFRLDRKEAGRQSKSLQDFFKAYSRYQKLLRCCREFAARSVCRSFNWETELGFIDYGLTGMATGLLWAGKGAVVSYLSRFIKMDSQRMRISVTPLFGRQHWESCLNCIFSTRLGHIIIVFSFYLIWLLKDVWDKKRRGDGRWRNILLKI